jgi:hypothetical protein
MHPKPSPWPALLRTAASATFLSAAMLAGQSAPSISAGGVLPAHDARIAVAKEVVHVSDRKVVVEYDLRNDGPADMSEELQFPVPPYQNQWDMLDPAVQAFRSLKLWADDKPIEYKAEAKAELNGEDITKTLEKAHIDVATFGHLELGRDQHGAKRKVFAADYERLPPNKRHHLRSEGIFKGEEGYTLYTVRLRYYWQQNFPAHSTIHIREEYVPAVGFTQAPPQVDDLKVALTPVAAQPNPRAAAGASSASGTTSSSPSAQLNGFCADSQFIQTMVGAHKVFAQQWGQGILPHWVDFNLLSDTGWHKPIEDFTLQIDIPQTQQGLRTLVSFCSPGIVEKKDSEHPQVHLTNYTPGTDLHIGFFNAPAEQTGSPVAAR